MRRLVDVLDKYPQYEDIKYSPAYNCPNCMNSSFYYWDDHPYQRPAPILLGWTDTPIGFQVVAQCPFCFTKFRFHGTAMRTEATLDQFNECLLKYAKKSKNWKDISKMIEE